MASFVPRPVLRLEDIDGLEEGSVPSGNARPAFAPVEQGLHRTAQPPGHSSVPLSRDEARVDKLNRFSPVCLQSPRRQRCNSIVPHHFKANYAGQERLRTPRRAAVSTEDIAFVPSERPAQDTAGGEGKREHGSRLVFNLSSDSPRDGHGSPNRNIGRKQQLMGSTGSRTSNCPALDLSVFHEEDRVGGDHSADTTGWEDGKESGEGRTMPRPWDGTAREKESLRRSSLMLQRDLDEAVKMVCHLHGRLLDASRWTSGLREERDACREQVARLLSQIQQMPPGTPPADTDATRTSARSLDRRQDIDRSKAQPAPPRLTTEAEARHMTEAEGGVISSDATCSSDDDASGAASFANSRSCSPLLEGVGGDRMVPMYTPSAVAAVTDTVLSHGRGDGAGRRVSEPITASPSAGQRLLAIDEDVQGVDDGRRGAASKGGLAESGERAAKGISCDEDDGGREEEKLTATNGGSERNDSVADKRSGGESARSPQEGVDEGEEGGQPPPTTTAGLAAQGSSGSVACNETSRLQAEGPNESVRSCGDVGTPAHRGGQQDAPWGQRGKVSPRAGNRRRNRRGKKGHRVAKLNTADISRRDALTAEDAGAAAVGGDNVDGVETETGTGPDPAEADGMLQTLAGLSTTLRRSSYLEDTKLSNPKVRLRSTADGDNRAGNVQSSNEEEFQYAEEELRGVGSPEDVALMASPLHDISARRGRDEAVESSTTILASRMKAATAAGGAVPCERCVLLSESVEDLRERARLSGRLLEHSERLRLAADARLGGTSNRLVSDREAVGGVAVGGTSMAAAAGAAEPGAANDREARPLQDDRHHQGGSGREGKGDREHRYDDDGGDREELLAATEAVWRISEMAREVLERELDRRGEALTAAKVSARDSNEAISAQLQELSSVKAALRNQEGETERWKKEAEKVGAREKDTRRALESARVASTAAARRSEREGKALRVEVEALNEKVASLRTRLACVQGRRQAEVELAAKKAEQEERTIANLENALAYSRSREQLPAQHSQPPYDNDSPASERRRSSSRGGEFSVGTIRERGKSSGSSAVAWDRYGHPAEDVALSEAEESFASLSQEGEGGGVESQFPPRRKASIWEEGGEEGPGRGRGGASAGGGDRRRSSAASWSLPSSSPARPSKSSTTRGCERKSDSSSNAGGRLKNMSPFPSSGDRKPSSQARAGVGPGRGVGSIGRRASALEERVERTVASPQRARRVSAPVYGKQAEMQADLARLLRRASRSHPPPAHPQDTAVDSTNTDDAVAPDNSHDYGEGHNVEGKREAGRNGRTEPRRDATPPKEQRGVFEGQSVQENSSVNVKASGVRSAARGGNTDGDAAPPATTRRAASPPALSFPEPLGTPMPRGGAAMRLNNFNGSGGDDELQAPDGVTPVTRVESSRNGSERADDRGGGSEEAGVDMAEDRCSSGENERDEATVMVARGTQPVSAGGVGAEDNFVDQADSKISVGDSTGGSDTTENSTMITRGIVDPRRAAPITTRTGDTDTGRRGDTADGAHSGGGSRRTSVGENRSRETAKTSGGSGYSDIASASASASRGGALHAARAADRCADQSDTGILSAAVLRRRPDSRDADDAADDDDDGTMADAANSQQAPRCAVKADAPQSRVSRLAHPQESEDGSSAARRNEHKGPATDTSDLGREVKKKGQQVGRNADTSQAVRTPGFWDRVGSPGLSDEELESALEELTEEEAFLREKGVLDGQGNLVAGNAVP